MNMSRDLEVLLVLSTDTILEFELNFLFQTLLTMSVWSNEPENNKCGFRQVSQFAGSWSLSCSFQMGL